MVGQTRALWKTLFRGLLPSVCMEINRRKQMKEKEIFIEGTFPNCKTPRNTGQHIVSLKYQNVIFSEVVEVNPGALGKWAHCWVFLHLLMQFCPHRNIWRNIWWTPQHLASLQFIPIPTIPITLLAYSRHIFHTILPTQASCTTHSLFFTFYIPNSIPQLLVQKSYLFLAA